MNLAVTIVISYFDSNMQPHVLVLLQQTLSWFCTAFLGLCILFGTEAEGSHCTGLGVLKAQKEQKSEAVEPATGVCVVWHVH